MLYVCGFLGMQQSIFNQKCTYVNIFNRYINILLKHQIFIFKKLNIVYYLLNN